MGKRGRRVGVRILVLSTALSMLGLCADLSAATAGTPARSALPTVHASSSPSQPGWTASQVTAGAHLNGIDCPTFDTCFAVGGFSNNASLIEETTNGGQSWFETILTSTENVGVLDAVTCVSATHCIATGGGGYGTAFSTSDGSHWSPLPLPAGTADLTSVTCVTASDCWAASSKSPGVFTTDGGADWSLMSAQSRSPSGQTLENFGVSFPSSTSGWIAGEVPSPCDAPSNCGYIQHSTNGGHTWAFESSLPVATPALAGIACPSTSECLAVGATSSVAGVASGLRTTDGGQSWSTMTMPASMDFAEAISCGDVLNCFAVGFGNARYLGTQLESSDAVVAHTTNGGASWTTQPVEGGLYSLTSVSCSNDSDCRAVGATYKGVSMASTTDAGNPPAPGYWLVASDGGVFAYGSAHFYGSTGGIRLNKPVVGIAADPLTGGYWMVATDGGIFAFNAPFYGSTGGVTLAKPIVGMAVDPVTGGYWMVASDGGIFAFNAPFYGSTSGQALTAPIVGIAALGDGAGYFLVGQDGNVYPFGAAVYSHCTGNPGFRESTVGMAVDPNTGGYWLASQDGGLAYCAAPFYGDIASVNLEKPVVGITADPATGGYWFDATDGGIFAFNAPFLGSTGGIRLNKPVVGIATVPGG